MKKYKLDNYKYYDSIVDYLDHSKKMTDLALGEEDNFEEPDEMKASDNFHNMNNYDAQKRLIRLMRR